MTQTSGNDSLHCHSCKHFEAILFRLVGECTYDNSDHRGHILSYMHPACSEWGKKK